MSQQEFLKIYNGAKELAHRQAKQLYLDDSIMCLDQIDENGFHYYFHDDGIEEGRLSIYWSELGIDLAPNL